MMESTKLEEKLKQYEGKLATLTAINGMLQSENDKLREDLEIAQNPTTDAEEELAELKEEFAERLGEADAQVAKYKDECQKLRAQLRMADKGGSASSAKLAEKDQMISTLRSEGESLSRNIGELEAQVRKLRSAERESEAERERLMGRVQVLEGQLVVANEQANRSSVESHNQLEQLERELEEARRSHALELGAAREEARRAAQKAEEERERGGAEQLAAAQEREATLLENLQSFRATLEERQTEWDVKETSFRREIATLQDSLRDAEARSSETQYNSSEATKPLLKQIELMSSQHAAKEAAQQAIERSLTQRIKEMEEALSTAAELERGAKRRAAAAEAAVAASKEAANTAVVSAAELRAKVDAEWKKASTLQAEKDALRQQLEATRQEVAKDGERAETERRDLQERLWDAEQRVRSLTAELDDALSCLAKTSRSMDHSMAKVSSLPAIAPPAAEAPQPSTANGSDTLAAEDELDGWIRGMGPAKRGVQDYGGYLQRGASRAGVEAQLEILQQQLEEAQQVRDYNAEELCSALRRADAAEADANSARQLKEEKEVLQRKMDICLEILGERNERIEQLQDDIVDMKRIFHEQLNVCVEQLAATRSELEQLKVGAVNGKAQ
mmetsp:Transcript_18990/g.52955  ORF Transcript_18990/g.52955 Transcript_18990/m.52955 type:complete len:620 (+) Transcript_18990:307-2166(+)